jgi:predicted RNase H-like HicB family nuclease
MTLKVLVHQDSEGGFWAEVPSLPGCMTQGESLDEVRTRIAEAINAYLEDDVTESEDVVEILEIAV